MWYNLLSMDRPRPKWTRLSKETVFSSPYFHFSHDSYVLPGGGVGHYHYVDIAGSAMVVPQLDSGELVLVRQHRYLMQRPSLEFPAGGVKPGSDFLRTAAEELQEEAGYRAARLEPIGEFAPYNGASNEICRVFWASGLTAAVSAPESTEEIQVLALPADEVRRQIAEGSIWDGMTIASFSFFELRGAAAGGR